MLIDHYMNEKKEVILLVICSDDAVIIRALRRYGQLTDYDGCPMHFVLDCMGRGVRARFTDECGEKVIEQYRIQHNFKDWL